MDKMDVMRVLTMAPISVNYLPSAPLDYLTSLLLFRHVRRLCK